MIQKLEVALAGIARVMRAMLGAPDYDRYLAHVRHSHPDREPVSREQFTKERMEARYSRPGTRCC